MSLEEYREMIRDYVFITKKEREEIHSDLEKDALFTNAMQFAHMALNSIDKLEKIAEKLIGTKEGVEIDNILKHFHNFDWEANTWREFYMTFNDDNERHCENSFDNHHFETENELRRSNEAWLKEVLNTMSPEEIIQYMPSARFYMSEDMLLNLKGE